MLNKELQNVLNGVSKLHFARRTLLEGVLHLSMLDCLRNQRLQMKSGAHHVHS